MRLIEWIAAFVVGLLQCRISEPKLNPTYLIVASKIVRPNTVYQVFVSLTKDATPMQVFASLSRDGVEIARNVERLQPYQSTGLLLKVPERSGSSDANRYRLRVEGFDLLGKGGLVFEREADLRFSSEFLSVFISLNRVAYTGEQPVKIRAIMLTDELRPFEGVADLFVVDPDGYIVRKWHSKHLNVGVMEQIFVLPSYPKVGFWKVRILTSGQVTEKTFKVEKHYLGEWEVAIGMSPYSLTSDENVLAEVEGGYVNERTAYGNMTVRWYAKKIDFVTPSYNDSVLYREEYKHYHKYANLYHSLLNANAVDGDLQSKAVTNPFFDPYANKSFAPPRPLFQEWTYIRSEQRVFHGTILEGTLHEDDPGPFVLGFSEIESLLGTLENIQVRASATMQDFYYPQEEVAFAETRIMKEELKMNFLGPKPFVFKPGMFYEGWVAIRMTDLVALDKETLSESTLDITAEVLTADGGTETIAVASIPIRYDDEEEKWSLYKSNNEDDEEYVEYDFNLLNDTDGDGAKPAPYETFWEDDEIDHEKILIAFERSHRYSMFRRSGIHRFRFSVPPEAERIRLSAVFTSPEQDYGSVREETLVYKAYSPGEKFLTVRSTNPGVSVGEFAVFHVHTNFAFEYLEWIIVSKNIIVRTGREVGENVHQEVKTFSTVVSGSMAPGFDVIAFAVTGPDNELVSGTMYQPVEVINRHKIELSMTQLKDHSKATVEATCRGDPGAIFMVASCRTFMLTTNGKNTVTKAAMLERLMEFDIRPRKKSKVFFSDRNGEEPDRVVFLSSFDDAIDSTRNFDLKNILILTDGIQIPQTPTTSNCNDTHLPCMVEGCFLPEERCDGVKNCEDGSDEDSCIDEEDVIREQHFNFLMSRQSRFEDFYDIEDGEWGWFTVNIDEDREQFLNLEVPETPDEFYLHAVSVSKELGLGFLPDPVLYSTVRVVDFYCEAPGQIHRGESASIWCNLINRTPTEHECFVILKGSDDYKFIQVGEYGYVTSYAPKLTSGDHHHLVYLRAESETAVLLPIAPQVEQGTITVTMVMNTQVVSKEVEVEIEILPEGSIVHRHTSALLDLKNRANVLRFMNIIVDETPIIPYEIYRRFIYGSPHGHFTICGDVIGPVFPNDEPVSLESMFPTGHGRVGKGTEYHAFNLGANTWQLHYLRLTNQLADKWDVAKTVFEFMNTELMAVMRRFSSQGWAKNWDHSDGSVWLTAWVLRIFRHVTFQDWEDFIYIDPLIISSANMWLSNYQTYEGAFVETSTYRTSPLHPSMTSDLDIALTAHVLIAMEETAATLQGDERKFAATSRYRATRYLERHLPKVTDGFEICLVAYALTLAKSAEADTAFGMMVKQLREEDGMVYWSSTPIKTNKVRYEFNRPFLEPKAYQSNDASAVEATAYALLTIFHNEGGGVTLLQDQIVRWLNTMRLGDGGFISTVDTLVALEALVRYSYNSRIKEVTDLSVDVELPDSNITETFDVNGITIATEQTLEIPNVWGHVNVVARGSGQAVAQLDVNYGIDYEPFKDQPAENCFNLTINEQYSGRNKSVIAVESCFSWTLTSESATSGMAVLVVDIPSGYMSRQTHADRIVRSGVVPELRDADTTSYTGKTVWFFDHIPNVTRCFTHVAQRYLPVANLTRTRQAVLVEPLRPERFFIRTFNATSLYILSVCEVCGSYQCPYCPWFNSAPQVAVEWLVVMGLVSVALRAMIS